MNPLIRFIMATFIASVTLTVNGATRYDHVHSLKIRSSWKEITDTATVEMPLLLRQRSDSGVQRSFADKFTVGDFIEITCQYQGLYDTYTSVEFKGFIKKISPKIPLTLECEDGSYWFRRVSLYKEWKKSDAPSLQSVLKYVVNEVNAESKYKFELKVSADLNHQFTTFRIGTNDNKVSAAEALQFLKDNYGVALWFDEATLYAGLAYTQASESKEVVINLQGNVLRNGNHLTFRDASDVQYVEEGKAFTQDNKVIEARYPATGSGDTRPFITYDAKDKATLEKLIKAHHAKLGGQARLEGYVCTKLVPFVRHSDVVRLIDPDFKEREGKYLVDTVELEFDTRSGFTRKIYPGIKLN